MAVRTNLFTNPSCETNTTGWSVINGSTLSSSADRAWVGTKSQKVVYDTPRAASSTGTSIVNVSLTGGVTYKLSAYVWVPTGMPAVAWQSLGGYTATGSASTTNDAWERISVTLTPGSNVTASLYILNQATSVTGTGFYADGAMMEASSTLGTYFDGDTLLAGYLNDWTGAVGNSTSTQGPRSNRCTNPSFEVNTAGIATFSVTAATSNVVAYTGSNSMKVTFGGTSAPGAAGVNYAYAVKAGRAYTFSAYVYVPTGQQPGGVNVQQSGQSTVFGTDSTVYDQWERLSVTHTPTADGTANYFVANSTTSALNKYFYVDAYLIEKSATVGTYFDGATVKAGYTNTWTGTANDSTSTEAVGRTNLAITPAFETGLGAWGNYGGESVISQTATFSHTGTYSMGVLRPSGTGRVTTTHGTTSVGAPNSESIPVSPGDTVTVSMYVRDGSGALPVFPMIFWQTASAFGSSASGTAVTTSSTWQRISVTAVAPAGTTQFGFGARVTTANFNQFFYLDDVLVEKAASLGAYFDGASSNTGFAYAWTGTANASTSTETVSTGGSATAALGITFQTGPVAVGRNAPLGVNAQTGKVSLGVTAHLGIDVGVTAVASGPARTAPLGVDVSAGPTSLGVSAPLGVDIETGPVALGVTAPLAVNVDADATASVARTAALSVAVATEAVTGRTAQLGLNIDADASWTAPVLPSRTATLSIEIITPAEAFFEYPPAELGTTPLGKLVSFNVSTSAVPLNPAEGSGAAPSVNAGYIKGTDPEYALGETNVLSWGTVGTYEGEVVRLSLPEGSDVATISQDTPLTLLNNELHLFPFIDAAPSTWTAARAVDYWSQQCGLFYDKVPGDCIAYASGYGHADSYGAGTTSRFYERLVGGTTSTTVLNNRSVKTLGSAVTGTTAFHELPEGSVPVSVPKGRKLVASIGLGIRGTGRTATVAWNMLDAEDGAHTISISATSAGVITAAIAGVPVTSTTVAGAADYRISFSIEQVSPTAVVGKLTVHTDDLDGTGTLEFESASTVASYALPTVLRLTDITHVSAGGSGDQMLRWGTYLTVATAHPMELPAVQKTLSETTKDFGFVSGFEGNVWSMLNEFCAITRLDVSFLDSRMVLAPRSTALSVPVGNFSRFSYDAEVREKYKQVAVVNKQSRAVSTDDAVLWRADSVFQVAAREVFETTVQTGHSILNVVQPVAVDGILPFPYTVGGGEYVVTGADGYIVAPAWWNDNGGLVEVSLTGKEGEIAIKITAPIIDTVRAPYRISEGAADRPALYVSGSGILNDPKEVHVGTGAKNAREGFDNVFESPFIAGPREAYDTAVRMAAVYSESDADLSFELPNDFYTPTRFGQYPSGTRFTDGKRNYRIVSASQSHSKVSGSAVPNTTIGDYVASYPEGATIADELARHAGRTIKQFNINPLRGTDV